MIDERLKYLIYKSNDTGKTIDDNNAKPIKYFTVPFSPSVSEKFSYMLRDIDSVKIPYFSVNKLNKFIKGHKDPLSKATLRNVIYKIDCKDCNASYVDQTGRQLHTRIEEHKKHITRNNFELLCYYKSQSLDLNHEFKWDEIEVLNRFFISASYQKCFLLKDKVMI